MIPLVFANRTSYSFHVSISRNEIQFWFNDAYQEWISKELVAHIFLTILAKCNALVKLHKQVSPITWHLSFTICFCSSPLSSEFPLNMKHGQQCASHLRYIKAIRLTKGTSRNRTGRIVLEIKRARGQVKQEFSALSLCDKRRECKYYWFIGQSNSKRNADNESEYVEIKSGRERERTG